MSPAPPQWIDHAAGLVRTIGCVWQGTAAIVFGAALLGWIESLPAVGDPLVEYVIVALLVSVVVLGLVFIPYGGDRARQMHLIARAFGWQGAIGSVLAFSFALSTPSESERTVAFFVGVLLVFPSLIGVAGSLLAEALEHRSRTLAEARRAAEVERLALLLETLAAKHSTARRRWWHR